MDKSQQIHDQGTYGLSLSTVLRQQPKCHRQNKLYCVEQFINKIDRVPKRFRDISVLYLSNNMIDDLTNIAQFSNLQCLSLNNNMLGSFDKLRPLKALKSLHTLSLQGNGVTKIPFYRYILIHMFPQLTKLDLVEINTWERNNMNTIVSAERILVKTIWRLELLINRTKLGKMTVLYRHAILSASCEKTNKNGEIFMEYLKRLASLLYLASADERVKHIFYNNYRNLANNILNERAAAGYNTAYSSNPATMINIWVNLYCDIIKRLLYELLDLLKETNRESKRAEGVKAYIDMCCKRVDEMKGPHILEENTFTEYYKGIKYILFTATFVLYRLVPFKYFNNVTYYSKDVLDLEDKDPLKELRYTDPFYDKIKHLDYINKEPEAKEAPVKESSVEEEKDTKEGGQGQETIDISQTCETAHVSQCIFQIDTQKQESTIEKTQECLKELDKCQEFMEENSNSENEVPTQSRKSEFTQNLSKIALIDIMRDSIIQSEDNKPLSEIQENTEVTYVPESIESHYEEESQFIHEVYVSKNTMREEDSPAYQYPVQGKLVSVTMSQESNASEKEPEQSEAQTIYVSFYPQQTSSTVKEYSAQHDKVESKRLRYSRDIKALENAVNSTSLKFNMYKCISMPSLNSLMFTRCPAQDSKLSVSSLGSSHSEATKTPQFSEETADRLASFMERQSDKLLLVRSFTKLRQLALERRTSFILSQNSETRQSARSEITVEDIASNITKASQTRLLRRVFMALILASKRRNDSKHGSVEVSFVEREPYVSPLREIGRSERRPLVISRMLSPGRTFPTTERLAQKIDSLRKSILDNE